MTQVVSFIDGTLYATILASMPDVASSRYSFSSHEALEARFLRRPYDARLGIVFIERVTSILPAHRRCNGSSRAATFISRRCRRCFPPAAIALLSSKSPGFGHIYAADTDYLPAF